MASNSKSARPAPTLPPSVAAALREAKTPAETARIIDTADRGDIPEMNGARALRDPLIAAHCVILSAGHRDRFLRHIPSAIALASAPISDTPSVRAALIERALTALKRGEASDARRRDVPSGPAEILLTLYRTGRWSGTDDVLTAVVELYQSENRISTRIECSRVMVAVPGTSAAGLASIVRHSHQDDIALAAMRHANADESVWRKAFYRPNRSDEFNRGMASLTGMLAVLQLRQHFIREYLSAQTLAIAALHVPVHAFPELWSMVRVRWTGAAMRDTAPLLDLIERADPACWQRLRHSEIEWCFNHPTLAVRSAAISLVGRATFADSLHR